MAITKILPVRGQLKGCLDYAANPQKTEYLNTADMQRLMNYTQNGDKTEHQLYVSGFNKAALGQAVGQRQCGLPYYSEF